MNKRAKPGQPSPWANLPATPIRLPQKFHAEIRAVAKLLDSGSIDSTDLLNLATPRLSETPTFAEIQASIEGLTQAIVTAEGWDLTAVELGFLTATLEESAQVIDKLFSEKAKIEAMAIATKKTNKRGSKTDDT